MYIEYVILALIGVPLLGFAAGLYSQVRKGRTLGESTFFAAATDALRSVIAILPRARTVTDSFKLL